MSLKIIQNDITAVNADAVVVTAGRGPADGAGIDKSVYDAADYRRLTSAREKIGVIEPGHAAVTRSYVLPSRYIIYTAVPVWQGGGSGELEILRSCYRESLRFALKLMCRTVAIPLFPSGDEGYPEEKVLETAFSCFREFLDQHEMEILFLVKNTEALVIPQAPEAKLSRYVRRRLREQTENITGHLAAKAADEAVDACDEPSYGADLPDAGPSAGYLDDLTGRPEEKDMKGKDSRASGPSRRKQLRESVTYAPGRERRLESVRAAGTAPGSLSRGDKRTSSQPSLSYVMTHVGENFRDMLLRLIDEKGLSDPYVYKKANLDRKLFSKIRCNPDYCPSRKTVIALAIALELTLEETTDLLSRAGYAFSPGSRADLIVEFCIINKIYDIFEVDMLLFKYGQPTLC